MFKSKRDNIILAGVLAALVAGAVLGVYLPQSARKKEIRQRIDLEEISLQQTEHKIAVVPTMAKRVEAMRREYSDFDRKLPKRKELGEFLRQINNSLSEQNLSNHLIQTGKTELEGQFHRLPITMRFSGGYLPLCTFLDRMAKTKRLAQVRKLVVNNARENQLDISLQMNIYFKEG
ncbi:MAG: type 4a pilus biogenesis protein PilO [Phycisphaerae bacterium]